MTDSAPKSVLLVFEDGDVRQESIQYSVELVRRTGGELQLLMLVGHDRVGPALEQVRQRFSAAVEAACNLGLTPGSELRAGDKASEFLKFLAYAPACSTVVWGSSEQALLGRRRGRPRHWLGRLGREVSCPIVTPRIRKPTDGG